MCRAERGETDKKKSTRFAHRGLKLFELGLLGRLVGVNLLAGLVTGLPHALGADCWSATCLGVLFRSVCTVSQGGRTYIPVLHMRRFALAAWRATDQPRDTYLSARSGRLSARPAQRWVRKRVSRRSPSQEGRAMPSRRSSTGPIGKHPYIEQGLDARRVLGRLQRAPNAG